MKTVFLVWSLLLGACTSTQNVHRITCKNLPAVKQAIAAIEETCSFEEPNQ